MEKINKRAIDDYQIILASASPRRKELLTQIGLEFQVDPAIGEETLRTSLPSEAVQELSKQKAEEIAVKYRKRNAKDVLIIGADTVVALEDRILGKPKDKIDACSMLKSLAGKKHAVYTGVTMICIKEDIEKKVSFYEKTDVTMYPFSDEEILSYVESKEPMDKAGSYAIQGFGAVFIKQIEGDYSNVVGLPVASLYQQLKTWKLI